MNHLLKNKKLFTFLAVVAVITLSSCNRGVGCPSDFSMLESILQIVQSAF